MLVDCQWWLRSAEGQGIVRDLLQTHQMMTGQMSQVGGIASHRLGLSRQIGRDMRAPLARLRLNMQTALQPGG